MHGGKIHACLTVVTGAGPEEENNDRARLALVASFAQWVEGARPRTLPNAIAPVIAFLRSRIWQMISVAHVDTTPSDATAIAMAPAISEVE